MAKQVGIIPVTGTIGNLTFYKMENDYYVRRKSSLDSKRVKTSPRFVNTMRYADYLAKAAPIASEIYRLVPKAERKMEWYRKLTGQAIQLIKKGKEREEILAILSCFKC